MMTQAKIAGFPRNLTIERLPNGLIRVFDHSALWSACYNSDGSYRFGPAPNSYSGAVENFLANESKGAL